MLIIYQTCTKISVSLYSILVVSVSYSKQMLIIGASGIIIDGEDFNSVLVNERIVRERRAVNRLAESVRDRKYLWNTRVPLVNRDHPDPFVERLLINSRLAFAEELTALTPE